MSETLEERGLSSVMEGELDAVKSAAAHLKSAGIWHDIAISDDSKAGT